MDGVQPGGDGAREGLRVTGIPKRLLPSRRTIIVRVSAVAAAT